MPLAVELAASAAGRDVKASFKAPAEVVQQQQPSCGPSGAALRRAASLSQSQQASAQLAVASGHLWWRPSLRGLCLYRQLRVVWVGAGSSDHVLCAANCCCLALALLGTVARERLPCA